MRINVSICLPENSIVGLPISWISFTLIGTMTDPVNRLLLFSMLQEGTSFQLSSFTESVKIVGRHYSEEQNFFSFDCVGSPKMIKSMLDDFSRDGMVEAGTDERGLRGARISDQTWNLAD